MAPPMPIPQPLRRPPSCPPPSCDSRTNPDTWRFVKKGTYLRDQKPRRIQKYRCSHCGRYFSSQTFSVTYWLRRPDLLRPTFHRLVSCSGLRQIAREFRVSHTTIRRLSDRLGRHCLLFHEQTSSRAARTTRNPLFAVNLSDLLLRHSSANHKRETIAFSKRRQSAMYRAAIWTVWRNYMKDRSENRRLGPPAKALGLVHRALALDRVLATRLFPDRAVLSAWLRDCYFGRIRTRAIEHCVEHRAVYAR